MTGGGIPMKKVLLDARHDGRMGTPDTMTAALGALGPAREVLIEALTAHYEAVVAADQDAFGPISNNGK